MLRGKAEFLDLVETAVYGSTKIQQHYYNSIVIYKSGEIIVGMVKKPLKQKRRNSSSKSSKKLRQKLREGWKSKGK